MAHYLDHCADCERLLGVRFEEVNLWMDEAFKRYGPKHRFDRHHWGGVRKVEELFGREAAKAAIVHIVRDCGHVPEAEDYPINGGEAVDNLGIGEFAPEMLYYDGLDVKAADRFKNQVEQEWNRYAAMPPVEKRDYRK